jgi:hypothetical protein
MYATKRNQPSKMIKQQKPFCKVCMNAGKTEQEYTSHFTRASPDANAPITCPTILAIECRYCKGQGHTPKYCPVLKEKEKQTERRERAMRVERENMIKMQQAAKRAEKKEKNSFAALMSDSEDESDTEEEEYVPVSTKWAEVAAAAPKPLPEKKTIDMQVLGGHTLSYDTSSRIACPSTSSPKVEQPRRRMINWAEEESSDEEDEEEERIQDAW